ncbi:MAG: glucokinase, partial [Roseococcus sp.]
MLAGGGFPRDPDGERREGRARAAEKGPAVLTPALLADIGGTHARFARAEGGRPGEVLTLRVAEHARFEEALALARARLGSPPRFLCAVAGPVEAGRAALTNAPWVIEAATLPFAEVRLLNDLEAMAWALPVLAPGEVEVWGAGATPPTAPPPPLPANTQPHPTLPHTGGERQ